jgi:hypothetical protein
MKTDQTAANQEVLPLNLSQELDDHGIPFVRAKDGTTVCGEITQDQAIAMGTAPAPLKLSLGNRGYGLRHIVRNREQIIKDFGYNSVEDFVEQIAKGYDSIQRGKSREIAAGVWKSTFMLIRKCIRKDERGKMRDGVLYVEFVAEDGYYHINSGGMFESRYTRNKESGELWRTNA